MAKTEYEAAATDVSKLLNEVCHQSNAGVQDHLDGLEHVIQHLKAEAKQVRESAGRELPPVPPVLAITMGAESHPNVYIDVNDERIGRVTELHMVATANGEVSVQIKFGDIAPVAGLEDIERWKIQLSQFDCVKTA